MITIYLDDCTADRRVARALRAAGLSVFLPGDAGTAGFDDEIHLRKATELGAVLSTFNVHDFRCLDREWRDQGLLHSEILLCHQVDHRTHATWLIRAARTLTPEVMQSRCLHLELFRDDASAQAIAAGLGLT